MNEVMEFINWAVSIKRKIDKEISKTPGRMNLLDISKVEKHENLYSDIIAYLLNPSGAHHHQEFGELFLESLKRSLCLSSIKIINITRENPTDQKRRIDILVETESDVVIIENKIDAYDLEDQLNDYLSWAGNYYKESGKNINILYLTLSGTDPEPYSLPPEIRKKMEQEKRYANISYKKHILDWLKKLINQIKKKEEKHKQEEKELTSAIIQVIDSIEYICGDKERSDKKMQKKSFAEKFDNEYSELNRQKIRDLLDTVKIATEHIYYTAIIQFLSDIKNKLDNAGYKTVYTHQQNRYEKEEWIERIKNDPSCVGIEVPLEKDNDIFQFGLGIEFSGLNRITTVTYGIMSHGHSKTNSSYPYEPLLKEIDKDIYYEKNHHWWEFSTEGPWFTQALFRESDWEDRMNKDLSKHVFEGSFNEVLNKLKPKN